MTNESIQPLSPEEQAAFEEALDEAYSQRGIDTVTGNKQRDEEIAWKLHEMNSL